MEGACTAHPGLETNLNERLKLGSEEGGGNDRMWVLAVAGSSKRITRSLADRHGIPKLAIPMTRRNADFRV